MKLGIFIVGLLSFSTRILFAQAHVIITAGQSNTDGRVSNSLLPAAIKKFATDTIHYTKGAYPYCKISQNRVDGIFVPYFPKGRISDGVWTYDAIAYYLLGQRLKEDFYVVKYAVGGTSIQYPNDSAKGRYWSANEQWLEKNTSFENGGSSLLLSFTNAIDAAIDNTLSKLKNGYQIDAFLWHQGESDDRYDMEYYQNLKSLITYVRNHLTRKTGKDYSDLPFIFGTIPTANRHYKSVINTAMQRISDEDINAILIDMSQGELQIDKTHFNEKSAEYLGSEMFKILDKKFSFQSTGFRVAKYKDDKRCAISYTFDDGLLEHATLVAPTFNELGLKATFFINGKSIIDTITAGNKPRVNWEQLHQMAHQGHEISNHGWAHLNMGRFSLAEITQDIEKNDSAIYFHTGVWPPTYAYPNNTKQPEGIAVASKGRVATRLFQNSLGGKSTEKNLDNRINQLLTEGSWGVMMTHGITYGYDHFKDSSILWNHLRKVKALEKSIWVGRFCDVAAYIKEQKMITYTIEKTKSGFVIIPTLKLDQKVFNEILTGVIEKSGMKNVTVYQGKTKLNTKLDSDKLLFDFNPYGEKIRVYIK